MIPLTAIAQALGEIRRTGMVPAELHINPGNYHHILQTADSLANTASPWEKLKRRLRGRRKETIVLCGLPVFANDHVPEEGICVRMQHQMHDPNWLEDSLGSKNRVDMELVEQEEPDAKCPQPTENNVAPSIKQIFPQRGSTEEMLANCMAEADEAEGILIIMARKDGTPRLWRNLPTAHCVGLLHVAFGKLSE